MEVEVEEDGMQGVEVEEVVGVQVAVLKETQEVVLQFLLYQSLSQQQLVAEVEKVEEKVEAVAVDGHQVAEVKAAVVVVDGLLAEVEVKEVVADGLQEVEEKEVEVVGDGLQEEEVEKVVEVEEPLSPF